MATQANEIMEFSRWIVYGITLFVDMITISILSTSDLVYTTISFCSSKVIDFYCKVLGRLYVLLLLCFSMVPIHIYNGVALGSILWYFLKVHRAQGDVHWYQIFMILIVCVSISLFIGLVYMTTAWKRITDEIARVEEDYAEKSLLKSTMKLIKGTIRVSFAVFILIELANAGTKSTLLLLLIYGYIWSLSGTIFGGNVWYSVATILIHSSLVIRIVIYVFSSNSYHNKNNLNIVAPFECANGSSSIA